VEEIGILAQTRDDMLVPDLGQHGAAGFFQGSPPLLWPLGAAFVRA
jgi:hypothetical protein